MAIVLVDLEFREKAKQMLTSRELIAVVLFLLFALLPWVEILDTARNVGNGTWWQNQDIVDSGPSPGACNPHNRACI